MQFNPIKTFIGGSFRFGDYKKGQSDIDLFCLVDKSTYSLFGASDGYEDGWRQLGRFYAVPNCHINIIDDPIKYEQLEKDHKFLDSFLEKYPLMRGLRGIDGKITYTLRLALARQIIGKEK